MKDTLVRLEHQQDVSVITLARRDGGNALNPSMIEALEQAVKQIEERGDTAAVVILAEGKMFSTGGDLLYLADAFRSGGENRLRNAMSSLAGDFHKVLRRLLALDALLVTGVWGAAVGGGMGLALAVDVLLVGPSAQLVPAYSRLGLTGDGGATWFLPRLCGDRLAREMLMLGRVLSSAEMVDFGIASRMIDAPDEEAFRNAVIQHAADAARNCASPFGLVRQLLLDGQVTGLDAHLDREAERMGTIAATPEVSKRILDFAEKKTPRRPG